MKKHTRNIKKHNSSDVLVKEKDLPPNADLNNVLDQNTKKSIIGFINSISSNARQIYFILFGYKESPSELIL